MQDLAERASQAAVASRGNQPERLAPPIEAIAIRIISRLEKQLFVLIALTRYRETSQTNVTN